MGINFSDKLFVKQTRNAILIALLVGIIVSFAQILFDFFAEQRRTELTVNQVINTSRESAVEAAFSLNNELALKVVKGLFEYRPIHYAEILDDFGRRLAYLERPLIRHDLYWLGGFIKDEDTFFVVPLFLEETQNSIGEMRVKVDPFITAQDFLDRAGLIIMTGLLRNLSLAILVGVLFYFTLGRPVAQTIRDVSKIDPAQPADFLLSVPKGHERDDLGELVYKINDILVQFEETLDQRQMSEEELRRNQNTIKQLNQRLEERVRIRTSELEAANREMEAFTYSVSHDLRAPLRTIGGFNNILIEEYADELDEKALHYLDRVQNGTTKMERLINDMLKLSRSTRGDLYRTDFLLDELFNEVAEEHTSNLGNRNVTLDVEKNMDVNADKRFVRVILDNLISNALKYSASVENTIIAFGKKDYHGSTTYYISDNGVGFDMAYGDKMFAPFQRLHSSRDFDGSGIGLATVQRAILRHGGEVWAEAEVGEGATIYFTLPRPL